MMMDLLISMSRNESSPAQSASPGLPAPPLTAPPLTLNFQEVHGMQSHSCPNARSQESSSSSSTCKIPRCWPPCIRHSASGIPRRVPSATGCRAFRACLARESSESGRCPRTHNRASWTPSRESARTGFEVPVDEHRGILGHPRECVRGAPDVHSDPGVQGAFMALSCPCTSLIPSSYLRCGRASPRPWTQWVHHERYKKLVNLPLSEHSRVLRSLGRSYAALSSSLAISGKCRCGAQGRSSCQSRGSRCTPRPKAHPVPFLCNLGHGCEGLLHLDNLGRNAGVQPVLRLAPGWASCSRWLRYV